MSSKKQVKPKTQGRPKGRKRANSDPQMRSRSNAKKVRKRQQKGGRLDDFTPQEKLRDPRYGKSGITNAVKLATQITSVPLSVKCYQSCIQDWARGYLAVAIQKGVFATTEAPYYPYFAFLYMVDLLTTFALGNQPKGSKFPYVVLAMGRALSPKSHTFGQGKVSYSYLMQNVSPNIDYIIGYTPYNSTFSLGWVNNPPDTPENGFPLLQTSAVPAYTEEVGSQAFAQMNTILAGNEVNSVFRSVSLDSKTSLDTDVSTYSLVSNVQGFGSRSTGGGGFAAIAQSEVPISRPFLATFNVVQQGADSVNRFFAETETVAGDPIFIGAGMSSFQPEKYWSSRWYPKFHAIDFNEFADVLAQWVVLVVEASLKDNPAQVTEDVICPLTLQEMCLVLRAVCMQAFKDTQTGVQGLGPILPTSANDNQFTPYVCGSGTSYNSPVPMQLPMPLVENIRACSMRGVEFGRNRDSFIPVLGQFFEDVLSQGDYLVQVGDPPVATEVFFPTASVYQKDAFDKAGRAIKIPLAETPISLIDGRGTGGILAINDPTRIGELCGLWNDWVSESNISNFSTTTGVMGAEKGINILCSSMCTRHWVEVEEAKVNKAIGTVDCRVVGRAVQRRRYSTVYADRQAVADTCQSDFIGAAYEQVLSIWVLPSLLTQSNTSLGQSTVVPRSQIMLREVAMSNTASTYSGKKMSEMHASYAARMVKGKLSAPNDWQNFFAEASRTGRGGILSGLIANWVGKAVPALGGIASGIASALPI